MIAFSNLSQHLLREVPEFVDVYREHVVDNHSVLNYILFEQLAQFLLNPRRTTETNDNFGRGDLFGRVCMFIEAASTSTDASVRNVVMVSFLEPLLFAESRSASLIACLGPESGDLFKVVEQYFLPEQPERMSVMSTMRSV